MTALLFCFVSLLISLWISRIPSQCSKYTNKWKKIVAVELLTWTWYCWIIQIISHNNMQMNIVLCRHYGYFFTAFHLSSCSWHSPRASFEMKYFLAVAEWRPEESSSTELGCKVTAINLFNIPRNKLFHRQFSLVQVWGCGARKFLPWAVIN